MKNIFSCFLKYDEGPFFKKLDILSSCTLTRMKNNKIIIICFIIIGFFLGFLLLSDIFALQRRGIDFINADFMEDATFSFSSPLLM